MLCESFYSVTLLGLDGVARIRNRLYRRDFDSINSRMNRVCIQLQYIDSVLSLVYSVTPWQYVDMRS